MVGISVLPLRYKPVGYLVFLDPPPTTSVIVIVRPKRSQNFDNATGPKPKGREVSRANPEGPGVILPWIINRGKKAPGVAVLCNVWFQKAITKGWSGLKPKAVRLYCPILVAPILVSSRELALRWHGLGLKAVVAVVLLQKAKTALG